MPSTKVYPWFEGEWVMATYSNGDIESCAVVMDRDFNLINPLYGTWLGVPKHFYSYEADKITVLGQIVKSHHFKDKEGDYWYDFFAVGAFTPSTMYHCFNREGLFDPMWPFAYGEMGKIEFPQRFKSNKLKGKIQEECAKLNALLPHLLVYNYDRDDEYQQYLINLYNKQTKKISSLNKNGTYSSQPCVFSFQEKGVKYSKQLATFQFEQRCNYPIRGVLEMVYDGEVELSWYEVEEEDVLIHKEIFQ